MAFTLYSPRKLAAFILKKVYSLKWIHTFHAIEKLRVKGLSKEEKEFEWENAKLLKYPIENETLLKIELA